MTKEKLEIMKYNWKKKVEKNNKNLDGASREELIEAIYVLEKNMEMLLNECISTKAENERMYDLLKGRVVL